MGGCCGSYRGWTRVQPVKAVSEWKEDPARVSVVTVLTERSRVQLLGFELAAAGRLKAAGCGVQTTA